jgi:AAA domain, putative AbiEii toxin, Type IV TA system
LLATKSKIKRLWVFPKSTGGGRVNDSRRVPQKNINEVIETLNSQEKTHYPVNVPVFGGSNYRLTTGAGTPIVIVGANGSGKTRLGVYLENQIPAPSVQRISAQKSLHLRNDISLVSFERAEKLLRTGHLDGNVVNKLQLRWGLKPSTHLLNDVDALQMALFGAHNRAAAQHLNDRRSNPNIAIPITKLDKLKETWEQLLPHRVLHILEASISVSPLDAPGSEWYPASEMSDGERSIFYFIGQSVMAPENGVVIVDEPESHVHKAILGRLWDAIEAARPDCGFVYITHDLDFAVCRAGAQRFVIRAYKHAPEQWDLCELPEDSGIPDALVAEIVGSRRPILFFEGGRESLDYILYTVLYPQFLAIPVGSCEHVIHSVITYNNNPILHRFTARGVIDADDRDLETIRYLEARDVYSLPVAEIESVFAIPEVFLALSESLSCAGPQKSLDNLKNDIFAAASSNVDVVSARYTSRQIDRKLKKVETTSKNLEDIRSKYEEQLKTIDAVDIFTRFKSKLAAAITAQDLAAVLRLYDNKGVANFVAQALGLANQRTLSSKLPILISNSGKLFDELQKILPRIPV